MGIGDVAVLQTHLPFERQNIRVARRKLSRLAERDAGFIHASMLEPVSRPFDNRLQNTRRIGRLYCLCDSNTIA
ncbi:hypothetical protein AA102526_2810 [Asaia lannensis NBRC 102526]|nr:hypothetical protein AA102526_2810 [Asaia lannensis NBRC 102526]